MHSPYRDPMCHTYVMSSLWSWEICDLAALSTFVCKITAKHSHTATNPHICVHFPVTVPTSRYWWQGILYARNFCRSSILEEVQNQGNTKLPSNKNVLVLGDNETGKTTLVAKLQGVEDPKKGSALEYAYIDVRDEYRDGKCVFL